MSRKYDAHRRKRAARRAGRDRRIQAAGGRRIQSPEKMQGTCAGCLGDIRARVSALRKGDELYCSADCLIAGRHWVDPSLCGGCGGTHRLGERP